MKLFFFVIGFLILFFAAIILVALQYVRRGIKKLQKAVTGDYDDEETFRRMADKHYRPKAGDPKFDKDYFKSKSGGGQGAYEAPKEQPRQRTTTTADGVTVIDERAPKEQRKIFTEEEGEYVDYTEV